jgi:hypothetical protein
MNGCVGDKSGDVGDVEYMLHADKQASDRATSSAQVTSDAVDSRHLPLANAMCIPERDLPLYSE